MFDLEKAISTWRRLLKHRRYLLREDLEELEQHVRDQVASLQAHGLSEEQAFHRTMAEMGAFDRTEAAYREVFWGKLRQRGLLFTTYLKEMFMFRNFIKLAFRNMRKNKLSTVINLLGLSVAVGCSIVVFVFADFLLNANSFHEHADEIYLATNFTESEEGRQQWGDAPIPLGTQLAEDFPQVIRTTRLGIRTANVEYRDKVFDEIIWFADPAYLEMFTFPLEKGNKEALQDPQAVILSDELALKYFGDVDPIGKQLTLTFEGQYTEIFTVRGVGEDFPLGASFGFHMLINFEKQLDLGLQDLNDWSVLTTATFVQVKSASEVESIQSQLEGYVTLQNEFSTERLVQAFAFEPLIGLTVRDDIRQNYFRSADRILVIVFMILGLSLVLLACFNYVNIALAFANKRLKEIGVRKVVGSSKFQLISQFLAENVILCTLALGFGFFLALTVFFPGFLYVFDGTADVSLAEFFANPRLWLFFLFLLILTGLGAGAYPAFYISKFQPVKIFRGKQKISGRKGLTRFLLTFQFILSFLVIILGLLLSENNEYQKSRDWGYNQDQVLVVPVENAQQFALIRDAVRQQPGVKTVAGTIHHIGRSVAQAVIEVAGEKHEVIQMDIGQAYFNTMGLRIASGESFNPALEAEEGQSIMINETLAENLGWEAGMDLRVRIEDQIYHIIGIVEDFHYTFFFQKIEPLMLRVVPEEASRYLVLEVEAGEVTQTHEALEAKWANLFPELPYEGFFQDAVFDGFFVEMSRMSKMFLVTAMMALLLSCMGLFGLVSLNITQRMKEISIRKVLGASVREIAKLLNLELLILLTIATLSSLPTSYFLFDGLLDSAYEYRAPIGPVPFIWATLLIFTTALLTVATQVYKAATANPVRALRTE